MDHFLQMVSNASVSVDHAILNLLVMAENLLVVTPSVAVNESAQLDAERIVHVFTVIGDIASANLSEDEERRYDMPGGTVLQVMAPSRDRVSSGFVLGPFTVPPLDDVKHENTTVQSVSWAKNLFGEHDVSDTMLTISVRTNGETLSLENLDPPLLFRLPVNERMDHPGTDAFHRRCVFWNTTSGNWSNSGLQAARENLTQVDMVVSPQPSIVNASVSAFACLFMGWLLLALQVCQCGVSKKSPEQGEHGNGATFLPRP